MILIRLIFSGYPRRTYIAIVSLEKFGYPAKLPEWSDFCRILNQHHIVSFYFIIEIYIM